MPQLIKSTTVVSYTRVLLITCAALDIGGMMTTMKFTILATPVGPLTIAGDSHGVSNIRFPNAEGLACVTPGWIRDDKGLCYAREQLGAYFEGQRRLFDLSLRLSGSGFQIKVLRIVQNIPYGETASYGEIARLIGSPGASRAVGAANGGNPLPIVIPCHRVIGSQGQLTGYSGGLPVKRWLLQHEARQKQPGLF